MTVDEVTNNKTKEQPSRSSRRRRNREVAATQGGQKDRPTPARRERRGNFITRFFRGIADYFASTRAEIQKVTWPTRQEALRLSGIVIAVTVVSSIALGLLDYLYGELFRVGFSAPTIFGAAALIVAVLVVGATFVSRRI
ncbi:MAG: hypothetical protein Kow0077_28170 [Anaerolineae bacterium]